MTQPNDDELCFTVTPAGRAALTQARVADALATLPGWEWDPDDLTDCARAAAAAVCGR